jgi:tRNA(adenine34) deaminase
LSYLYSFGWRLQVKNDEYYMNQAIKEARKAIAWGDVPIGAVVVLDGKIIARARNEVERRCDPLAHAEILAIKKAVKKNGYKHLLDATLYVTLEPCSMCCGAAVLARLKRIVFAANDTKTGAAVSLYNIPQDSRLNHRIEVSSGVLQSEASAIIKDFFKELRKK